ncbi:MAG: sugar phosphate nucleotidyltransferase [Chlamydiales bacterium]
MLVNFLAKSFIHSPSAEEHKKVESISCDRIAVIILGGGQGKRLEPLTTTRCKPAVAFGGRYSLIDVPISHSLSSGLTNIYVIGQYLAYTLQKHLSQTYLNYGILQNRIQMLVPEEREGEKVWYKGTADAVRKNLKYFYEVPADYFLILSGDQLYNINFQDMIQFAAKTDASMVIAAQPVNKKDAKRMGVLKIQERGSRLLDFYEKPQTAEILERFYTDDFTLSYLGYDVTQERNFLGSMGIYLFKRQALFDLLREDPRDDFGRHLIDTERKKGKTYAYLYDGYWEDIGTIKSYYEANLALTQPCQNRKQGLVCYDERSLIITKSYDLPGAQISDCKMHNTLLCEGSIIKAKEIDHSVIGVRSIIGQGSIVKDSILMGNEYYERPPIFSGESVVAPSIGENTLISKAIIDENVIIGDNVQLTNRAGYINYDSPDGKVVVRDGILIVPKAAYIPDNYIF